jgi:hypothetical protein
MKPITLEEALSKYVHAVLIDSWAPQLYLKDETGDYHPVDVIDLARDRLRCDDGYWEYYNYILQAEDEKDYKLFVEVNDDE